MTIAHKDTESYKEIILVQFCAVSEKFPLQKFLVKICDIYNLSAWTLIREFENTVLQLYSIL